MTDTRQTNTSQSAAALTVLYADACPAGAGLPWLGACRGLAG